MAGTGVPGFSGDGGPATDAQVFPSSLVLAAEGNLYFSDQPGRVRRVDTDGVISTVAGTGDVGYSGDGGPATEAEIGLFPELVSDPEGNLYLVQFEGKALRKISPDGTITTVAADPCLSPGSVAVDPVGAVYLVCEDNKVLKIDPAGAVTTVAGTGLPGLAGDGGPATEAEFSLPGGIAIAPDGSLYIGDVGNARIRKIDPDGVITTVAGIGTDGYPGDGGPATEAQLNLGSGAGGLVLDAEGNLYIADAQNYRVRRVTF